MGYVGLPLSIAFSKKYSVVGFDKDENRIIELKSGIDKTQEIKKFQFHEPQTFQYKLRSQPNEINSGIATSLLFSAWNACTYVGQISDKMVREKESDQSYVKCVEEVIKEHNGLWFNDEMLIIEKK